MTKIETNPVLRKTAQEVEIDYLLAEEFSCDPSFAERFIEACGLSCPNFKVSAVIPEPSLSDGGFGDLFVDGISNGLKVAFLIEDKITSGPAVRQAERYAAHASWLLNMGWYRVWTILVAPASYRGERTDYDESVDLEAVASILRSPDPMRLAYRRGIIERALVKKASTGVQIPDTTLHSLKAAYLNFALKWCAEEKYVLEFPALRGSYYDGDSWIHPIRSAMLPRHVVLRHRIWTSVKAASGQVDLIVCPATPAEKAGLKERRPLGSHLEPYSKGKGIQISFPVPEMRQKLGFDAGATTNALMAMKSLVQWFLEKHKPDRP